MIYDATTIKSYLKCPRYYFYRIHKGWVTASPKPALIFGLSMHAALENIYSDLENASPEKALISFTQEWLQSSLDPEEFHPRSVPRAKQIIEGYFTRYKNEMKETRVLGTEVPFTIELNDDNAYGGRVDAVIETPNLNGPFILEHKTASSFKSDWIYGFNPDIQIFGYAVAIRSFYENARGHVLVNGILVQKSSIDFMRVPCMPSMKALEAWRWEVLDTIEEIKYETKRLTELGYGFRKNPEACTMWGQCEFLDLCQARPAAQDWLDEIEAPTGYNYEPWDFAERHHAKDK
jgi:hypothetical protein